MKKTLLISIQPQHLLNILNGDKTYEVRKVVPKWVLDKLDRGETVEAYLYCTKGKPYLHKLRNWSYEESLYAEYQIGNYSDTRWSDILNGTIPVKVVIDGYIKMSHNKFDYTYGNMQLGNMTTFLKNCQLSHQQLIDYGQGKDLYALHISKVEILDEVMKLGDFKTVDISQYQDSDGNPAFDDYYELKRPPQNMMSVWVKGE